MMIYYRVKPGWSFFLVPLFLGGMVLLAFSVSMILAALNVRYRDVKYALPFLVQIWLFVTPIIYPVTFLPPKMKRFLAFNPMAGFLEGFRSSLLNSHHMDWRLVASPSSLPRFFWSLVPFTSAERRDPLRTSSEFRREHCRFVSVGL